MKAIHSAPEVQEAALNPHVDFWAVRDGLKAGDQVTDLTGNRILQDLWGTSPAEIWSVYDEETEVAPAPDQRTTRAGHAGRPQHGRPCPALGRGRGGPPPTASKLRVRGHSAEQASATAADKVSLELSLAIVIPAFNTQASLERVLTEISEELHSNVIIVDDGSETAIVADGFRLIRHPSNRRYGAAQKTGYDAALAMGAERIVLLHGDGQYATEDVLALNDVLAACDAAIGSRFLNMEATRSPRWRRLGNRTLTIMANVRFGTSVSGCTRVPVVSAETLRALEYHRFSDDYIFDHEVLSSLLDQGARIGERKVVRLRRHRPVDRCGSEHSLCAGGGSDHHQSAALGSVNRRRSGRSSHKLAFARYQSMVASRPSSRLISGAQSSAARVAMSFSAYRES